MGNYEQLKQAVSNVIKTNGNQEITGAIMQNTLLTIISTVGENATFAGIATPETNHGTPDQNVFYLASEPGIFGNAELTDQVFLFINKNGNWVKQDSGIATSKKLFELENKMATKENLKSYVTNLIYDDTSLYQYLKFVDGIKYELSTRRYENDENYFYIEIEKENCPGIIVFKTFDNRGYKYQYYKKYNYENNRKYIRANI